MKQTFIKNALILIVLIFTVNCSKDDDNTVVKTPNLEFRVQGHGLRLFEGTAYKNNGMNILGYRSYNQNEDIWTIGIRFPDAIGIYEIDETSYPDLYINAYQMRDNCQFNCAINSYTAISGTVHVVQTDANGVKGTFNCVLREENSGVEKVLHSGEFDIEL